MSLKFDGLIAVIVLLFSVMGGCNGKGKKLNENSNGAGKEKEFN